MTAAFPRVGSALLVRDENNRVLLGKRNKDPQRGSWVIPGGKIRPFESIAETAARELREETGYEVEVQEPFRVYEIINAPDEHRIVIYSWGKLLGGEARASDDLSQIAFFSADDLLRLQTSPLVRRVLVDAGFIRNSDFSPAQESVQLSLFIMPDPTSGFRQKRVKLRAKQAGDPKHRPTQRSTAAAPLLLFESAASS